MRTSSSGRYTAMSRPSPPPACIDRFRPAPGTAGGTPPMQFGFGACARSGCRCSAYRGSAGNCADQGCRHPIGDHW